jgi:hypothetical protein
MRRKSIQLALWTFGIAVSATLYVFTALLPLSNAWPWMALSGIIFVLAAIAMGGRRDVPFGG